MKNHRKHIEVIETTVGDLITSIYDAAWSQYHDAGLAARIAEKTVARKRRQFRNHTFPHT